jgi:hypothetical protein
MRALEGLAQACMMVGDAETASAHYSTMLELNPADHQGARYPLLALLLAAKEADAALSLMDIYAEDDTAPMAWGRALAAYQKEGTTATAGAALAAAQRKDARIAPFLTGNRRLTLEELQPGDEEAATIAMLYGPAWEATVGAREWLMRTTGLTQAPPTKAKRSGPRALDSARSPGPLALSSQACEAACREQVLDCHSHPVIHIACADDRRGFLDGCCAVAHGDARACYAEHLQVVAGVAEGDDL